MGRQTLRPRGTLRPLSSLRCSTWKTEEAEGRVRDVDTYWEGDVVDTVGDRIKRCRKERGWKQVGLAERLGVASNTVYCWEAGRFPPSQEHATALARLFGRPLSDFLRHPETPTMSGGIELPRTASGTLERLAIITEVTVDRRLFVATSGAVMSDAALHWMTEPERIVAATTGGIHVDGDVLREVESMVRVKQNLNHKHAGVHMLSAIRGDLNYIVYLLKHGSYSEESGQRLYAAAAEMCRMAGWAAYEDNDAVAAQYYFTLGLKVAHLSEDRGLGAYLLVYMAITQTWLGHPKRAIDLVNAAQEGGRGSLTPRLKVVLLAEKTRAHGVAKDVRAIDGVAGEAIDTLTAAGPVEDDSHLSWVNMEELHGMVGRAYLAAGDPTKALPFMEKAASVHDVGRPRHVAMDQARLATVYASLAQFDSACGLASDAADAAERLRAARLTFTLGRLAKKLAPHGKSPIVSTFIERVRELHTVVPNVGNFCVGI